MAHLLIVELPGGNDTDVIEAARSRGDTFTFLTADLSHYQKQPQAASQLALARARIEVPGFEMDTVMRAVLSAHAQCPIDAVLCLIDIRLIEAAQLAARLGTRHLSVAAATLLRDKFSVRRHLAQHGIPAVPCRLATSTETLKQAVDELGLPVLIKPSDGYGSQNIVVLREALDLEPWLSPLDELLPSRTDYGLGVRANDRLLVERCLQGQVIGCDTFSHDGQHRLLGVHHKVFFQPPSFAIRGGSFVPGRPGFAEVEQHVEAILNALDYRWGAAHIEMMLTEQGPRLIEVNARLVGAKIARLVSLALGRSVHADLIALHLGQGLPPTHTPCCAVAVTRWIVALEGGTLDHIALPTWHDDRIRNVDLLKVRGDAVRAPLDNADRLGCVMVTADTSCEAEALADRFVADVQVVMQ